MNYPDYYEPFSPLNPLKGRFAPLSEHLKLSDITPLRGQGVTNTGYNISKN